MALGETLDKFAQFEVAGVPVGAGVYYIAASQVADFLSGLIGHFLPVPVIVTDAAAAYALKVPVIEDFLGKYGSHYASMAAVGNGLNKQFNVSGEVGNLLAKLESAITGGVSGANAAVTTGETGATVPSTSTAPTSGYSNVDVGDLANITNAYADQFKVTE